MWWLKCDSDLEELRQPDAIKMARTFLPIISTQHAKIVVAVSVVRLATHLAKTNKQTNKQTGQSSNPPRCAKQTNQCGKYKVIFH